MSGLRQDVLDWYVRRHGDGWGAGDETAFQAWLAADARHAQAYAQWAAHSQAIADLPADALAQLRRNLQRDKAAAAPAPRRRFLRPALGIAAGLAIACGSGLLAWNHHQAQPVFAQAFSAPRGQQTEVSLPDGSRLRLDSTTRLAVTYYRQRREVQLLDGQAVFSVQGDAARPFHVLAGPVGVTVVGTRFAVRHTPGLPGNEGVRVSVEEGKVRVVRRDGTPGEALRDLPGAVYLRAGEQVAANAQGRLTPVAAVPGEGIALWRDSRISFVDTPLAQALAELERYGSTGLTVRDPAVAALRLSGTFDPTDAQTFRLALPSALPVRLKQGNGTTEVVSAR
ncbi:FecR domain-containing protein [Acidovorax sp. CCYZU-2555]|uniref:FecR family protein n=1 Tax=Acidovorax sp. CCYZU-2555 TaxID=2835042 RepID=UPI0020C14708|nr:FecR domain-containing protein [Acidovorax sp. CCYZU-2555]